MSLAQISHKNGNHHELKRKHVFVVNQFKYNVDPNSPLLRRLIAPFYFALIEFFGEKFGLVPWDHKDAQGRYSWRECQGIFSESWQAEREAAKYPHAWVTPFIIDDALPGASTLVPQIHPNATTSAYDRINKRTVSFPIDQVQRLQRKLKETESTMA